MGSSAVQPGFEAQDLSKSATGTFLNGIANSMKDAMAQGAQMALAKRTTDALQTVIRMQLKDHAAILKHPLYQIIEPLVIVVAVQALVQAPFLKDRLSPKAISALNAVANSAMAIQAYEGINAISNPVISLLEEALTNSSFLTEGI